MVTNLDVVLGSLGDQSDQFAKAVDGLSGLVETLEDADRTSAPDWPTPTRRRRASPTCWRSRGSRSPKTVRETDRAAGIVVADSEYFDNLLNTLPDAYQALARQGIYGDFFSFYLCDIVLKLNGKGGTAVYVKVAGQSTGSVRRGEIVQ